MPQSDQITAPAPPGGETPVSDTGQTIADLGKRVKQKYPQYQKLDDAQLGKMVRDKYPDAYGHFKDAPTPQTPTQSLSLTPSYKPQDLTGKDIAAAGVNAIPYVTGAVGAGFGGIPGAALGGAGGEAIKGALVSNIGQEKLSGPNIQVDPPPGSFSEATGRVLQTGLEQGANEVGGRLAGKLLRGAFGGALSAEGREYENALIKEASEKYGLNLTAPEITGKGHMAQRMGEYSFLSQGYVRKKWGQAAENGLAAIDKILGSLSNKTSPVETGKSMQGMFKLASDLYRREAQNNYETQLKPLAGKVNIDMKGVKQIAQDMLAKITQNRSAYGDLGGMGSKAEKVLENIAKSPDKVPFSIVHEMRSNLMEITPQADELMAGKAPGVAKRLVKETTEAIDKSLTAADPNIAKLWKDARAFYKDGAELFDGEVIRGLMAKNPVDLATSVKPHDADTAALIKKAILEYPEKYGDPSEQQEARLTWRQFQEQFARSNILKDPENVATASKVTPQSLADISERIDKIGPGVLREIYDGSAEGKEALANLRSIGDTFGRIKQMPTEGRQYVYLLSTTIAGLAAGAAGHGGAGLAEVGMAEGLPVLITGAAHSKKATAYLLDGIGGIIKAFPQRPMQALGKGVIKLQEKTLTSPTSYKELGPAIANIMRASEIVQADQQKMQQSREKIKSQKSHTPPGSGNESDPIGVMLNEWR